jgi:O-antigen ligase
MATLFNISALKQGNFMVYANQLVIAERVVFWQTGWDVFNDYPILGVGLGNTGYFFPDKMSPFGWGLVEVNHLIFAEDNVPNTKSMWSRLLSETGLVGFAVFLCWFLVMWATGGSLQRRRSPILRVFGLAGQLAVLAFLVEGFSIDSFALPYLWVTLGLAASAWRIRN